MDFMYLQVAGDRPKSAERVRQLLYRVRPESQRYFDFHHSARDRIDAIHLRSLEMGAASMSALYFLLDNMD